MKDPQPTVVRGRTHWRRFAAMLVPAAALTGAIVFGMANGALAASFAVSGKTFKVKADKLVGTGFVQYGGMATEVGGDKKNPRDPKNHPVAVSGMETADLYNLCQSVKIPNLPVVLTINAGDQPDRPAKATGLLLDVEQLSGDAVFTDIQIGRDASELTGSDEDRGKFGQSAKGVTITNLKQVAHSTSAATFTLTDLKLKVNVGADAKECF